MTEADKWAARLSQAQAVIHQPGSGWRLQQDARDCAVAMHSRLVTARGGDSPGDRLYGRGDG